MPVKSYTYILLRTTRELKPEANKTELELYIFDLSMPIYVKKCYISKQTTNQVDNTNC